MFLEQIINGIAIGMSYALVAVGYSMVFGVLRLINFSHSAVFTFGANTSPERCDIDTVKYCDYRIPGGAAE